MKNLLIEANHRRKTPLIDFRLSGELIIEGRSIPEDAFSFYQPAINWIDSIIDPYPQKITITFKLDYFNTSSSKVLLVILKSIKKIQESGKSRINVVWLYEENDYDMLEAGEGFQSITKLPFRIHSFVSDDPVT